MTWSGGLAEWTEGDTAFLSVAFSWKLPEAYQRAIYYAAQGFHVRAGGPAVYIRPKYLADVAEIGGEVEAVTHHNPKATVASRGCPVGCYFCIVPRMEGKDFTLLWDFIPRPVLMDNNIRRYQETGTPLEDANSGFEPRTFTEETYRRWKVINRGPWRFAFDEMSEGEDVRRMMEILKAEPASSKRVYVLIGNEPKAACFERLYKVIEWGGEPHAQPFMALNTLVKRPLVRFDWTEQELTDAARWANRWVWRSHKFEEYKRSVKSENISHLPGTRSFDFGD